MSEFNQTSYVDESASGLNAYITKVFTRMGIALAITAGVAYLGYQSLIHGGFVFSLLSGPWYLLLIIAQLGLCVALSAGLERMSGSTAQLLMFGYAAITGLTFSVLPLTFGMLTVFTAFAYAAVMFGSAAIIGHTTNTDLSKFTGILFGGLIALVLATVLSLFIPALRDSLLISYIGVLLFLGITAWDMQKIKQFYYGTNGGYGTIGENLSVYGSFQLYLDFINIFLYVLRILGAKGNRK